MVALTKFVSLQLCVDLWRIHRVEQSKSLSVLTSEKVLTYLNTSFHHTVRVKVLQIQLLEQPTQVTLTRRLVDVSQDVIVREIDCGTDEGEWVTEITDGKESIEPLYDRIVGRTAMQDVIHPETGEVLAKNGELITDVQANNIVNAGIEKVYIRSVLTCKSKLVFVLNVTVQTLLQVNLLMSVRQLVLLPHSQSVNRVHSHNAYFPRRRCCVRQRYYIMVSCRGTFEARRPKGLAIISEIGGTITVTESKRKREVTVANDQTGEAKITQFHTVQVLKFMTVTLLRRVTNLQWVL